MSERVGWTNGCFDILHPGHVHFLNFCVERCDKLVVGLNTDESVRSLKGEGRPVNDYTYRCSVLLSIKGVSAVVPIENEFDLKDHILKWAAAGPLTIFKGADYVGRPVVGWDLAPIRFVPLRIGYSTTDEIKKRDRLA